MAVFTPQLSILQPAQRALWPQLRAVTKLKVLLQRVEAKDYRDIAAMLKAGQSLDRGLAIARAIFGNEFQPSESLKSLTWFEGGDLDTLADEEKQILIEAAAAVRQLPISRNHAMHSPWKLSRSFNEVGR